MTVLMELIDERTIIVGHSLDTDLKVLCMVHRRVIDTAALFPHPNGLPYKHSLKRLAKEFLGRQVQDAAGDRAAESSNRRTAASLTSLATLAFMKIVACCCITCIS